jgi:predicted NUDIX family phosphoesterase
MRTLYVFGGGVQRANLEWHLKMEMETAMDVCACFSLALPKSSGDMAVNDEKVLAFPRSIFERLGVFQGFRDDVENYLPTILDPKNNTFLPRANAETDPNFKQIIPYVVVTDGKSILHYVRGKKAGEQRLVAKGSIGIGGHINDEDHTLFAVGAQAFQDAVKREVCEELTIQGPFEAKPVGLINDDSTDVGKVHFGIVHVLLCRPENVKKNEQVITQVEFLPIKDLKAKRDHMETWSQFCLDNLDALLK